MKKRMKSLLLVSILSLGIAFTAFKTKYVYCEEDYLSLPLFFSFFNLNWTKLGGCNYIPIVSVRFKCYRIGFFVF